MTVKKQTTRPNYAYKAAAAGMKKNRFGTINNTTGVVSYCAAGAKPDCVLLGGSILINDLINVQMINDLVKPFWVVAGAACTKGSPLEVVGVEGKAQDQVNGSFACYAMDSAAGDGVRIPAAADSSAPLLRALAVVDAATYDVLPGDDVLLVDRSATGVCAIDLKTAQVGEVGRVLTVKDSGGDASTSNITISTEGSETIDGAATKVISADSGSVDILFDGTNYYTI